ncbi:MAG: serine protease [Oligoflexales bacterium]
MKNSLLLTIGLTLASACKQDKPKDVPTPAQAAFFDMGAQFRLFFANSLRRSPTAEELKPIVAIGYGEDPYHFCTGYLLENKEKKTIIATANHCIEDYDFEKWCDDSGWARSDAYDAFAYCSRIILIDPVHDFVIFEADPYDKPIPHDEASTLRFSFAVPPSGFPLKMIGYPWDEFNNGNDIVTENCYALGEKMLTPFQTRLWHDDIVQFNNCTTYGGNSGGPIVVDGTRIVVGQPHEYRPDDYKNYDGRGLEGQLATTALHYSLKEKYTSLFEKEGIILASEIPLPQTGNYFASGIYASEQMEGCYLYAISGYSSDTSLDDVDIHYGGETCSGHESFQCEANICTGAYTSVVSNMKPGAFDYQREGKKATFRLLQTGIFPQLTGRVKTYKPL